MEIIKNPEEDERIRVTLKAIQDALELNSRKRVRPYSGKPRKDDPFVRPQFSPALDPGYMEFLMNSSNTPPEELEPMLSSNIFNLIYNVANQINGVDYSVLFTIPNILIAMKGVFSKIQNVPLDTIYCANKIIYNVLNRKDLPNKEDLTPLLVGLSAEINADYIKKIMMINSYKHSDIQISQIIAAYIVMARFSSIDETTDVMRVNFLIATLHGTTRMFNEQVLVKVYETLFDSLKSLTNGIMFDTFMYDEQLGSSNDDDSYDPMVEIRESASLQVNALFDMLTFQAVPTIVEVLKNFLFTFTNYYGADINRIRASFRAISGSTYRGLAMAVDILEKHGYYIP